MWMWVVAMLLLQGSIAGHMSAAADFDVIMSSNSDLPLQIPLSCRDQAHSVGSKSGYHSISKTIVSNYAEIKNEAVDGLCALGHRLHELQKDYYAPINLAERSVQYSKNISCEADNMNNFDAFFKKINGRASDKNARIKRNNSNVNASNAKVKYGKEEVHIYVMGGSLTAGRNVGGYNSAWPALLNNLLNRKLQKYSSTHFIVHNVAEPATSSIWALNRLSSLIPVDGPVDLVIIDYDVNDCAFMYNTSDSRWNYLSAIEIMIRRLLSYASNPAIMFLNVAVNLDVPRKLKGTCDMFHTCYSINDIRAPLLKAYGIPSVSQKEAIWEHFDCAPIESLWPCGKGFCSHPLSPGHYLLADLVFGFISGRSFRRLLLLAKNESITSIHPSTTPSASTSLITKLAPASTPISFNALMGIRDTYIQHQQHQQQHQQHQQHQQQQQQQQQQQRKSVDKGHRNPLELMDSTAILAESKHIRELKNAEGIYSKYNTFWSNTGNDMSGPIETISRSEVDKGPSLNPLRTFCRKRMGGSRSIVRYTNRGKATLSNNNGQNSPAAPAPAPTPTYDAGRQNDNYHGDYFYNSSKDMDSFFCKGVLEEFNHETSEMANKTIYRTTSTVVDSVEDRLKSDVVIGDDSKVCWDYTQDVAGKPGWISMNCPEGSIYFKIKLGQIPKLTVIYLSSYTIDWGSALFSIGLIESTSSTSSTSTSTDIKTGSSTTASAGSATATIDPTSLAYFPIGVINGQRKLENNEWKRHSIATSHMFCPQSFLSFYIERTAHHRFNNSQLLTSAFDDRLQIADKMVFLKVSPVITDKGNLSGSSSNNKFKIITVMTC